MKVLKYSGWNKNHKVYVNWAWGGVVVKALRY